MLTSYELNEKDREMRNYFWRVMFSHLSLGGAHHESSKRSTNMRSPACSKKSQDGNSTKKSRKIDFEVDDGSSAVQNSADITMSPVCTADDDKAPRWFTRFEDRFEVLIKDIKDIQEGLNAHIDSTEEKFGSVSKEMELLWDKIDDLENRGRRNNLVLYNVPEGVEPNPNDCINFMNKLSKDFIKIEPASVPEFQRAHRTPTGPSREQGRPRPIHIQFPTFQSKLAFRKAAVSMFKTTTFNGAKLFIQDDLSARVQKKRKELVPAMKKLREEGKRPFFIYPAVLKFWEDTKLKVYEP